MHDDVERQLVVEVSGQDRHDVGIGSDRLGLADTDPEPGADRGQLHDEAVGGEPEGRRRRQLSAGKLRKVDGKTVRPDDVMLDEFGERLRGAPARQIGPVGVETEVQRRQPLRDQRRLGGGEHAHGNVGLALEQIPGSVGERELDPDRRVIDREPRQDRRQPLDRDNLARGHADDAAGARVVGGCRPVERGNGARDRFGVRAHGKPGVGWSEAARGAEEQVATDGALELVDVAGDGWLGKAQPAGRSGEGAGFEDREEAPVEAPVRRTAPGFTYSRSPEFGNSC